MPLTATQQHFTKFYLAAFLRAPDLGGLNYWSDEVLVQGKSLQEVGGVIFSLPIVTNIYPANLSDLDFVEAIYYNVFGRTSDAEGLNYWSNEIATLRSGFIAQGHDAAFAAFEARGQLTINMINAGLGTPYGTDGKAYIVNRLDVAEYAAERQLAQSKEIPVATLLDIFKGVNASAASMFQGLHMVAEATKIDIDSVGINLADIANGAGGFVINGQPVPAGDNSGFSVSSAGDVNGDGLVDLIIGASSNGRSYVVFGKEDGTAVDLSDVATGSGGFVINRQASETYDHDGSGSSVSAAGDINGDGLADLIVGAPQSDLGAGGSNAGRSYVVFGKSDTTAVELSDIANGTGGFIISGETEGNQSGYSVSSAGDVNGDGLADLIVGAPDSDFASNTDAGRSYVVFGKKDTNAINLSAVIAGTGGFGIVGQDVDNHRWSNISVSGAGDVNGDGLSDLIVGTDYSGIYPEPRTGGSYVVFGKADGDIVNLDDVFSGAGGGFAIDGKTNDSANAGYSVNSAGDVNGDGLADLIVGVPWLNSGVSYVVFGKTDTTKIDLASVADGTGGFSIVGPDLTKYNYGGWTGVSVSSAGDVNGDGLADLIVGEHSGDSQNDNGGPIETHIGHSYLVFGKLDTTSVDLAEVAAGNGGFVINGKALSDLSGESVSAAGDVNGDGLADLVVGAPNWNFNSSSFTGHSYVIFGGTTGAFAQTAVDQLGSTGDDALSDGGTAQTLVGNTGNDSLSATAASVLHGGAGDDSLTIDSAMITALSNPFGAGGNISRLARIDGGTGIDTIMLSGDGLNLDLTQIANIGFDAIGFSRIESVEKIDLTGTGNNTLTLGFRDVMDMAGFNSFESSGVNAGRHQVMVTGNAGDVLNIVDGSDWTQGANVTLVGVQYQVFNADLGLATLYVDTAVSVI